jgi:hypothetical protein
LRLRKPTGTRISRHDSNQRGSLEQGHDSWPERPSARERQAGLPRWLCSSAQRRVVHFWAFALGGRIPRMEPVTSVTAAWTIAKTAGEIGKKLYEFGKSLKDREAKHQVDEIVDKLRELKQSASELEDENRDLREKLRFKSDDYEFRTLFWYERAKPNQPLCPKCFASNIAAPMGEQGQDCSPDYRRCLVCKDGSEVRRTR